MEIDEILKHYKEVFDIGIDYKEIENRYKYINFITEKLLTINYSLLFFDMGINELHTELNSFSIDDIIKLLLLVYYDFSIEEADKRCYLIKLFFADKTFSREAKYFLVQKIFENYNQNKDSYDIKELLIKSLFSEKAENNSDFIIKVNELIVENICELLKNDAIIDLYSTFEILCNEIGDYPKLDKATLKYSALKVSKYKIISIEKLRNKPDFVPIVYICLIESLVKYNINFISKKLEEYKKKASKLKKDYYKVLNKQRENEQLLKRILKKDFISEEDILKLQEIIKDEILLNECLIYIITHNCKYIDKNLHTDSNNIKIKDLFRKYNYNFDEIEEKRNFILSMNYQDLLKILEELNNNQIRLTYENLEIVLCNSSVDSIKKVSNLISKEYINNSYINSHIKILYDECYQINFLNNINSLSDSNINLDKVLLNTDLGELDYKLLRKNLYMVKLYKINFKDKLFSNFEFLSDSRCLNIIDSFIEEGLSETIMNCPEYIRKDNINTIKRVHINNLIGSNVMKSNRLDKTVLYEKNYFIKDVYLDEYLCSHTYEYVDNNIINILDNEARNFIDEKILDKEIVNKLDKEFLDKDNYTFESFIISRIKFLRNLTALEKYYNKFDEKSIIFNSLVYNSYLSYEEIKVINNIIESIYSKETNKKLKKNIRINYIKFSDI